MSKTQEALNEGEQMKNNAAMEDHWGNNPRFKKALAEESSGTEQPAQRCPLCDYQHGHAIGCENNPVEIALNKMAENARELGLDYESIVEQVEDSVGMGHKAWDMVDPKELAKGFHEALAEQPAQHRHISYVCPQCYWSLDEQPASKQEPEPSHSDTQLAEQCVCGEPDTPGTHRTDGPCLAEQPAQQQEPVAWMVYTLDGNSVCVTDNPADFTPDHRALPLYTSPPASKPEDK